MSLSRANRPPPPQQRAALCPPCPSDMRERRQLPLPRLSLTIAAPSQRHSRRSRCATEPTAARFRPFPFRSHASSRRGFPPSVRTRSRCAGQPCYRGAVRTERPAAGTRAAGKALLGACGPAAVPLRPPHAERCGPGEPGPVPAAWRVSGRSPIPAYPLSHAWLGALGRGSRDPQSRRPPQGGCLCPRQARCPSPPALGAAGQGPGSCGRALALVFARQHLVGPRRRWGPAPRRRESGAGAGVLQTGCAQGSLQSLPRNQELCCWVVFPNTFQKTRGLQLSN